MKKFQKIGSLILVAALSLSLAACSSSSAPESKAPDASKAPIENAGEVYEISYAGTVADTHPIIIAMKQIAEEMKEASNGQLVMSVYPNNQLGDSRSNLESMQDGTIQVGEVSSAPLAIFTENYLPLSLPFVFSSVESAYAWADGEFAAGMAEKTAEECDFRPVAWFLNGVRTLTNSKQAVVTPADMKGLKIRVMENDIYIKAFEAMGAAATPMSFAEVFTGLQQKTIDGQDNPLAINVTNAYYEVQSHWTDLNHTIDLAPIVVSESWYQSLPEDLRVMFTEYMNKAAEIERQMMADLDAEYQETMATGCEMTYLTDDQRAAFKDACEPVYTWFAETYTGIDLDAYLSSIG